MKHTLARRCEFGSWVGAISIGMKWYPPLIAKVTSIELAKMLIFF